MKINLSEYNYQKYTKKRAKKSPSFKLLNCVLPVAAALSVVSLFAEINDANAGCVITDQTANCSGKMIDSDVGTYVAGTGVYGGGVYLPSSDFVTIVNVDNLTADIEPFLVGNSAVFSQSTGGNIFVNVASMPFSLVTKEDFSAGIKASSTSGDVTVINTAKITTTGDSSAGIVSTSFSGAISVENSEGISTAGTASSGIFASSFSNAVTVVNDGQIATTGAGSSGIYVASLLGDVEIENNAEISVGSFSFGIFSLSSSGNITVTNNGKITSDQDGSSGIIAASTAGLGGSGVLKADISVEADIIISGASTTFVDGNEYFADGVWLAAYLNGGVGENETTVTVKNDVQVQGGSGNSAGVRFGGFGGEAFSGTNVLENAGTISALSGNAVVGYEGDEIVNNTGTIAGSVDLGSGNNEFNNKFGGIFESGSTVDIGTGNSLSNSGIISPGGAGVVQTTSLKGNLFQSSTGTFVVDLDEAGGGVDLIDVTGGVDVAGTVEINVIELEDINKQYTIVTASDELMDSGLTVTDTSIFDFDLEFAGNDILLSVKFASLSGLMSGAATKNQQAVAGALDDAGQGDPSAATAKLIATILASGDSASVQSVLNRLIPRTHSGLQTSTTAAQGAFADSMLSCKQRDGQFAVTKEGQCAWSKLNYRQITRRVSTSDAGMKETGTTFSGGVQFKLADQWRLGFAGGYESVNIEQYDQNQALSGSKGDRFQIGGVVKNQWGPINGYFSLAGSYGLFKTNRFVSIAGVADTARSRQRTLAGQARARVSYLVDLNEDFYLKPMVDFAVSKTHLSKYSESGAGAANLDVDASNKVLFNASPSAEIGGKMELANGVILRPYLNAGFSVSSSDKLRTSASFSDSDVSFKTTTKMDDIYGKVGVGFDFLNPTGEFTLKFTYDGWFGKTTSQHIGGIKASIEF